MTDKVHKIREEVVRLRNLHQMKYQQIDTNDNMCLVECGKRNLCNDLLYFIDSLQEEPVSEDFDSWYEKEWVSFGHSSYTTKDKLEEAFKAGANWQLNKLMKDAQECEVIEYYDRDICNYLKEIPHSVPDYLKDGDKVKVLIIKQEEK